MNQTSERKNEVGHRSEILKDIIDLIKKIPVAEFCTIFSINPVKSAIHGNTFIWQKGKKEIQESEIKDTSERLDKIITEIGRTSGNLMHDGNSSDYSDLLEGVSKTVKYLVVIPFLTKRGKKPLAMLFIGYKQSSDRKAIENKLRELISVYEHLLEDAWLVGKYKVIADIGKKINETLEDYQDIFNELFEKVSSILDTSYFLQLAIYHPQTNTFDKYEYYKYHSSPDKKGSRYRQAFEGSLKFALEQKKVISIFNYPEEIITRPELGKIVFKPDATPNPKSMIFIPLLLRGEILGVLSIQHEEQEAFTWEDVHIMELLGNQVSLALNSIRLYSHLESINIASAQLISPLSQKQRGLTAKTKEFLSKTVQTIKESTQADAVILFPYSNLPSSGTDLPQGFEKVRIAGKLIKRKSEDLIIRTPDDMACLVLKKFQKNNKYAGEFEENSQSLYSKFKDPVNRKGSFEIDEEIKSCAALPLKIEDEFVGALFINFRKPQKFSDLQKLHIKTLAQFAALSIRIQRDFLFSKQKYLKALQQIDSFIGKNLTLQEVMQKILDIAVEISKAVDSAIYLYDPKYNRLFPSAVNGPHQKGYKNLSIDVSEGKGLATKAFLSLQPQIDNDVRKNSDYLCVTKSTKSELDVPLIDPESDKAIGVINLESNILGAFQEEDKEFLNSIASQAALAIKVAQAKKYAIELSIQIQTTKDRAFKIITQKGDPDKQIQEVLDEARNITGAELALLQLYENGEPTKFFKSITKEKGKPIAELEKIEPYKDVSGIIHWVAKNKRVYRTNNTDKSPLYKGNPLIKSELAVPLKSKSEVYAVLDVESDRYNAFASELVDILKDFAITAVLAAQTASRALKATQDINKEKRRFQILHQATLKFSRMDYFAPEMLRKPLIEDLYDIVIDSLIEFRDEGEMLIRRINNERTSFELVKIHNQHQIEVPKFVPYLKKGKLASINAQAAEMSAKGAEDWDYIYVPDLENRPPGIVKPFLDTLIKCIVVVPITSGSNYYGNLIWSHMQKNFFDDSDILLVKGLATQLGGALLQLENVVRGEEVEMFSKMAEPVITIIHTLGNKVIAPINNNFSVIVDKLPENFESDQTLKIARSKIEGGIQHSIKLITDLKDKVLSSSENVELIRVNHLVSEIESLIICPPNINVIKNFNNIPGWVRVDLSEIMEIIEHLVSNALKLMPEGGAITLSVTQKLNEVFIEISDTGPGIPTESFDLIFAPKYSTTDSTGLGLWSSRRKAIRNFGKLYADPSVTAGAKFVLTLQLDNIYFEE
jgi:GAF domain-containing protein